MLSIVLPVSNLHEYTQECIDLLREHATGEIEIIVVDNASTPPYALDNVKVLRNETNIGFWPSLLQGIAAATNNIVLCMHNDVFIHERGYDGRLLNQFATDPKLAIAGFFGARGVQDNGARLHPESNMLGLLYGTPGNLHGHYQDGTFPAVVFDSLAMCFNRDLLYTIDYETIPPHHWTDRLVTLRLLQKGYHALTVGIAFDHGGGFTSSAPVYGTFAEDWCKARGLEKGESWDLTLYRVGETMFKQELGCYRLWTKEDHTLYQE